MNARAVRSSRSIALATLLLLTPASPAIGSQDKPQVTSSGTMQTTGKDGKAVALPLKHTDVDADIAGFVASVLVTQHFHNPYQKPIEAIYVFPLPHRAAIHELTFQVGKRTIKGVVKKRAEAKATYEQAKAQGKTATLLEQERDNIFTQSIANIMPGDQIKVMIRYVEDLPLEDGRYEFAFPMVVGPRYVGGGEASGSRSGAGWGRDTDRIPDASRITPMLLAKGLRPGNDIAVRLRINAGVKVQQIQVVTHKAKVQNTGSWASVELDKSDAIPNKDFVVRYQLAGARPAVTLLPQRDARGGHFLLMIQPKAGMTRSEIAPREYVFVIDRSGSQMGFPMEQSKALMRKCLGNVGSRDTFQMIAFESGVSKFAPRAVPATRANVEAGLSWLNTLSGGGGTEFIPALREALKAPKDPARSRIVFFTTDGYIGYEREVLKYLRENAKGVNLFPLGIGSSVNRFLIDGMARIGTGRPFYLLNTEKADALVERLFSTLSKPSLTSISIDWGGLDVKQMTPASPPDLFGEQPVFVAGRYERGGSATVTVRGRLAGKPYEQKIEVTLPAQPSGKNAAVAYLWARRQIADWSDLGAVEPNRIKDVEERITRTALKYNLMSQYTSFVAVDQEVRNQGGQQTTVPVPVALPSGVSPAAAPPSAYIGTAAGTKMSVGYGGLGGKGIAGPMRRIAARPALAATEVDAKKDESRANGRASHIAGIRLQGRAMLSGAGNRTAISTELGRLVRRLALELGARTSARGLMRLRLSLDAAGQVLKVELLSGSWSTQLDQEIKRRIGAWRFSAPGGPAQIVFVLRG